MISVVFQLRPGATKAEIAEKFQEIEKGWGCLLMWGGGAIELSKQLSSAKMWTIPNWGKPRTPLGWWLFSSSALAMAIGLPQPTHFQYFGEAAESIGQGAAKGYVSVEFINELVKQLNATNNDARALGYGGCHVGIVLRPNHNNGGWQVSDDGTPIVDPSHDVFPPNGKKQSDGSTIFPDGSRMYPATMPDGSAPGYEDDPPGSWNQDGTRIVWKMADGSTSYPDGSRIYKDGSSDPSGTWVPSGPLNDPHIYWTKGEELDTKTGIMIAFGLGAAVLIAAVVGSR